MAGTLKDLVISICEKIDEKVAESANGFDDFIWPTFKKLIYEWVGINPTTMRPLAMMTSDDDANGVTSLRQFKHEIEVNGVGADGKFMEMMAKFIKILLLVLPLFVEPARICEYR